MDKLWMEEFYKRIETKLSKTSEQIGARFPHLSHGGEYEEFGCGEGISWWTNGFWPGLMWLLYSQTGEEKYRKIAEECEQKLDEAITIFKGLHHDVGFMWLGTAVANYKITKNETSMIRGLHMATVLAGRFNPAGNFISSWNGEIQTGWSIIDSMMNLPILYWASEVTKNPRFKNIATAHADTVRKNFIRENGSSEHIVVFDAETGDFKETLGGQGYKKGSAWSRGQAWALYGFTKSYMYTKKESYLETAKKSARYFLENLPDDGIPDADFEAPETPVIKDASAGAIAASGLAYLAQATDREEKSYFEEGAERILRGLEKICDFSTENQSILQKCTTAYHDEAGRHVSLIYADYFMTEALLKLTNKDKLNIF